MPENNIFNNDPNRPDFQGIPNNYTGDFIKAHLPYAEVIARQRGLDPLAIVGQMALETNWGVEGSKNAFNQLNEQGQANFGLTDPRPLQLTRR